MPNSPPAAADDLIQRIEGALDRLVTLTVVTAVTPLKTVWLDADGHPSTDANAARHWELLPAGGDAQGMVTEINLLDGKIRNTISPAFATDGEKSLRDFHLQQVTQSRAIVQDNIEAVLTLAQKLRQASER